jgi:hypothetical protein
MPLNHSLTVSFGVDPVVETAVQLPRDRTA